MKKFFAPLFLGAFCLALCSIALAQEVIPPMTNDDFFGFLLSSLGGIKGAGALGIAYLVVQALMKFLGTPLAGNLLKDASGQLKITIYLGLTYVVGVLGLVVSGVSLGGAVLHATVLGALGVFANQLYKQFFVKSS